MVRHPARVKMTQKLLLLVKDSNYYRTRNEERKYTST